MNKKNQLFSLLCLTATILFSQVLTAQNPIWTLPSQYYDLNINGPIPLPTSPPDPGNGMPETDPDVAYQGGASEHTHGAYSDPNGELLFFTVDEKLYDSKGWVVNQFEIGSIPKRGYTERLILPMGEDCRKFGIIYAATSEFDQSGQNGENYIGQLRVPHLYFAQYDLDATNQFTGSHVQGELVGSIGNTLTDISFRDGPQFNTANENIYGYAYPTDNQDYNANIQIAATNLINDCFYYVFVFDGVHLLRYRLTESDLEWDGIVTTVNNSGWESEMRTEMELVQLAGGNYRIAIPSEPNGQNRSIEVYDINNTGNIVSGSHQSIQEFGNDSFGSNAEMFGIEFDPTGRYVYVTHRTNADLPNSLDVWDLNTSSFESIPTSVTNNVGPFEKSFIESDGTYLYLASDDYIGRLTIVSDPQNLALDPTFQAINSGYGNDAGTGSAFQFRYILPEQLDMTYPDLAGLNCDCCRLWNTSIDKFTATIDDTWAPGAAANPFGSVSGDVYIRDELIIAPGVDIEISNMNFYFGPDARVVVSREDQGSTGAYLWLTDGTVFTADLRCSEASFGTCEGPEDCDKKRWQGIIVEGFENNTAQSWNSSTPHARLLVDDNSMIEYAIKGAHSGGNTVSSSGGGMIRMRNARVKDCIYGVYFDPYVKLAGSSEVFTRSYVDFTEFTTTSDWFGAEVPRSFVSVFMSSGVYLRGNTYFNLDPSNFALQDRGIGVLCERSRVESSWKCSSPNQNCPAQDIVPNEYRNLYYGVYGQNSGLTTRTYYEYHSKFQNNYYGVYLNNFINPEVLDSEFGVMPTPSSTGIYLDISTGYVIENNEFSTYNGLSNNRNIGIYVHESGGAENEIYKNYFTNLTLGGVAEGVNADNSLKNFPGLDWMCNEFSAPIHQADIYLDGSMSRDQGQCSASPGPAGNQFSYSGSGHFDLYMTSTSEPLVDYNHHQVNVPLNLVPVTISTNHAPQFADWIVTNCPTYPYDPNGCPVQKTSLPDGGSGGPKSNDDAFMSPVLIQSTASNMLNNINELDSQLDGGQTDELLNLIGSIQSTSNEAEAVELINELENQLETIDGHVSEFLLEQLASTENSILENMADELVEANGINTEVESELNSILRQYDLFWQDAVSFYMKDTTGAITSEEMVELLQEFQPRSVQRFASIICPQDDQEWISSDNCAYHEEMEGYAFPAEENGSLPREIPEFYEGEFFSVAGNVNALNQYYYDHGSIYDPVVFESEIEGLEGDGKSTGNSSAIEEEQKVLVQPNPFSNRVLFDISELNVEDKSARIEIYDLVGKRVLETIVPSGQTQIQLDGSNLPSGYLTFSITVKGEILETGKLLHINQ